MKAIIIVMLVVQAAILLVSIWMALFQRQTARGRPVWSSLAFAMVIIAGTSIKIAETHAGQPGADVLAFGAPLLLGMALMAILVTLRQRRGLA